MQWHWAIGNERVVFVISEHFEHVTREHWLHCPRLLFLLVNQRACVQCRHPLGISNERKSSNRKQIACIPRWVLNHTLRLSVRALVIHPGCVHIPRGQSLAAYITLALHHNKHKSRVCGIMFISSIISKSTKVGPSNGCSSCSLPLPWRRFTLMIVANLLWKIRP